MVRYWLSLITLVFCSSAAATRFDVCVMQAVRQEHRLNRLEAIQDCFQKNKSTLNMTTCFGTVEKLKISKASLELSEQMKSLCFYDVSQFSNVNSCLEKSQVFNSAINKDEGVFECYRQFQNNLSTNTCLKISKLITYPLKQEHLIAQCYN